MREPRYTLTLTADQLYALQCAFDANFGSGIENADPTKAEMQVHKKLVRLEQKAWRHRQMSKG